MGPVHFGFNMFALSSFAPPLVDIMGKEHFLGAYLTGAVVSSFTSYFYRVSNFFCVSLQNKLGNIFYIDFYFMIIFILIVL